MNDELRRKVVVRKAIYFGVILALFTLSMFWRGVLTLPVGDPTRGAQTDPATGKPLYDLRPQDKFARLPVRFQADDLELRELDMGDPEIAGAAAQVSLIGMRGPVVTLLWRAAIKKQVRGEYNDMEFYARLVSRMQPHFIEPWIYQAWNIAYNVSVENDKLGDQYFYIARGISFLSEGDRINTRTVRRGGDLFTIGSPDIRHQLAFYYQNKFMSSDKVDTLRSLAQLSCIPPADRDPTKLTVDGKADGPVDREKFLQFCEANPQLVRRMKKWAVNPNSGRYEGMNLYTPELVVQFLAVNRDVPSRYLPTNQLAPPDEQFPVFPKVDPKDNPDLSGYIRDVLSPTRPTDTIDPVMAARAWFEYAQDVVPPPVKPGQLDGEPSATPTDYDPFRYRLPKRPALIIFRTTPGRAQSYLGERLQKEGWIDVNSVWEPDATTDDKWFPQAAGANGRGVQLRAALNSRQEFRTAHDLWVKFGRQNGMDPRHLDQQEALARITVEKGMGPAGVPLLRDYSQDELDQMGITPQALRARQAIVWYRQNREYTNYQYFVDSALFETDGRVAAARQLLVDAQQVHATAEEKRELAMRVKAAALWREAIAGHPQFYTSPAADQYNEQTLDQEEKIADLLRSDPVVKGRVGAAKAALGLIGPVPAWPSLLVANLPQVISADEAMLRIAAAYPSPEIDQQVADLMAEAKGLGGNPDPDVTRRNLIARKYEWMKETADQSRTLYWVRPSVRFQKMAKGAPAPAGASGPPQGGPPGGGPPPGGP